MRRYNPRHARATVTVTPPATNGSWGTTPGQPVTIRCRFVLAQKLVRAADGTDVVATAELDTAPELNPGKDLTALFAPGTAVTHAGTQRRVVGIETHINRGRLIYIAVTLS